MIPEPETGALLAVGIDTHADVHVAAIIDHVGRELGHRGFDTTPAGCRELERWARSHGHIEIVGIEGTGVYGAGICAHLSSVGIKVVEVDRPDRKARRFEGKSDPIDGYAAARAALSGRATGTPKTRDGNVEMIRVLRVARSSAIKARSAALTQLKAVITTAPEPLRSELRDLSRAKLLARCRGLRPARHPAPDASTARPGRLCDPTAATKATLSRLAHRITDLTTELDEIDTDLDQLVTETAPTLTALFGAGTDTAGQLLVTAGDNPDRMRSSAAFAMLCGVAPVPATSGKTQNRHRLNRGGDRQANCAIHRIALCRLRHDPHTRNYRDQLRSRGKTNKEAIRIIKRAIARQIYQAILTDLTTT